jgi:hypothetical protein
MFSDMRGRGSWPRQTIVYQRNDAACRTGPGHFAPNVILAGLDGWDGTYKDDSDRQ